MRHCIRIALILLLSPALFAQNLLITFQKPTDLYVCGTDTLFVEVRNTGVSALQDGVLTIGLPMGLTYVPGGVQGAVEKDLSNLALPTFALPGTAPNASAKVALLLHADCEAKKAIDVGQVFAATLSVQSSVGSAQIVTSSFVVQTGLLFIGFVDNAIAQGERDEVIERKIFFRNTRLGPISSLWMEDLHQPGLGISVEQADNQLLSPGHFRAVFDANFFSNFGDGDNLLEFGEQGVFTERVVIEDCGTPPSTITSKLRLGWGCDSEVCQYDSASASIAVLPSTKVPDLDISPIWAPSESHCGDRSAVLGLRIRNKGKAAAKDVLFNFLMSETTTTGMLPGSFRLVHQGNTNTIAPTLTGSAQLGKCSQLPLLGKASFTLPQVAAQDSLLFLFDVRSCVDSCQQTLPGALVEFFYKKSCPVGGFVSDTLFIAPDDNYRLNSYLSLKIGSCLQSGKTYTFTQDVHSKRLTQSDGFLHLQYQLPYGLEFDPACAVQVAGVPPAKVTTEPAVNQSTLVRFSFPLPLAVDSFQLPLCIRYTCDTNMVCRKDTNNIEEVPDPQCGKLCFVDLVQKTYWTPTVDFVEDCAIGTCEILPLVLGLSDSCATGDDSSVEVFPDPIQGAPGGKMRWDYQVYRYNLGLPDADDDRRADPAGTAHSTQLRRDRYLPGDTLRLDYVAVVDSGKYDTLYRYVYHEVVRSDIGGGSGNDAFEVKNAQGYFIQKDRIRYLRSRIEVHYADGTSASCEVPEYVGAWNERLYKLGVLNTQPPSILDEVVTMRHSLRSSFSGLYDQGLLPKPKLEKGDTVRIYTDFVMATNFTPFSSNQPDPPLIGFRTAMSHTLQRYIWNKAPARKGQYSGFKEARSINQFSIRPCDPSSVVKPFQYRMRIARQNMFPYEVRPLARISEYHQSTPTGLEVASAQLQYLVLQDSVERLKNFPLNTAPQGAWAAVDFQQAFADPIDEGFSLALQTTFQPNCYFDLPDTSRQAIVTQYAPGLKEKTIQTDTLTNKLGFFSNNPALRLETADTVVYSPQVNFDVDFSLRNWVVPPAPNLWVTVVSPSGMASDFKLVLLPSGQPLTDINGIYRLNTLQGFSTRQLRLLGRNVNCAPDSLLLIYGWGCTPLNSMDDSGCWRDTFLIELRLQNAELELDVKKEPPFIRLCEPSDYYEVEVYNAKIGYAYDPAAQVKLPPGLDIVPGSCQISYPVGSPFVNIADPQPLPGNVYNWDLGQVQPAIGASGLPGVDLSPANALRIRFRTQAECGFVSNAQPLYGADATDPCGRSTNVLNKPGKPLNIFGLNPTYGVQVSLKAVDGGAIFCGGEARYEVEMSLLGQPSPGDSVYVLLPSGVTFKTDSYKPLLNAPNSAPTSIPGGFRLALPTNLGGGISVKFQFEALLSQSAGCIDQTIVVQTRVRSVSLCVSTGQPCSVYVNTGEAFLKIEPLRPELTIGNVALSLNANNQIVAEVMVNNVGTTPASGATVQLWSDVDGNGLLSAPDVLRQTLSSSQPFQPGTNLPLSGLLNLTAQQLCGLLAVLPAAENCACAPQAFPLENFTLTYAERKLCDKSPVQVGVTPRPGAAYEWKTPALLACTTCATTTLVPDPNLPVGQSQVLVLEETSPGCRTVHRFTFSFGQTASATANNSTICAGKSVTLSAFGEAAIQYAWSGQDIQNPTAAQPMAFPLSSQTYFVTVTFAGGCTATASVSVAVLNSDSVQLPVRTTCPGTPVQMPGKWTDQAGIYSFTYSKSNGCDSTVTQQLTVLDKISTSANLSACRGDTLWVFGKPVTQNTQECQPFTASNGCDSVHCIVAKFHDLSPVLPTDPDTIFREAGTLVTLTGPAGYASYTWSPLPEPPCSNCREIEVQADSARLLTYTLTVRDPNGCAGDLTYRVLFTPPCAQLRIVMPTAFTPNGDGVNDVFRVVPFEDGGALASLSIYDRWGKKVYENTREAAWDGTLDGKEAQGDVYVWVIEIRCGDERVKKVGEVTVLR